MKFNNLSAKYNNGVIEFLIRLKEAFLKMMTLFIVLVVFCGNSKIDGKEKH